MPHYLLLTIFACLAFGIAAVLQKYGVSKKVGKVSLKGFAGKWKELLKSFIANPVWIAGVLLEGIAAALFFQALSEGEITVVQPLVNLNVAVTVILGVLFLHERLSGIELVSVVLFTCGALLIGLGAQKVAQGGYPLQPLIVLSGFSVAIVFLALVVPLLLKKSSWEVPFSIATGIMFGMGTLYMKVISIDVLSSGQEFVIVSPYTWWAMLKTFSIWFFILWSILGFLFLQISFSHGRVSIVMPVVTVVSMIVPFISGLFLFSEKVGPTRVAGLLFLAAGSLLMIFKKNKQNI